MLKIIRKDGRVVPIACCDACGTWIDDAELAAVVYQHVGFNDGDTQEVAFAHKGACHDAVEKKLSTGSTGVSWLELKTYLANMVHNSGVTIDAIQVMVERDDKFGSL